ncbi:23S rRNA (2'-O-methyl-G2251)-methyltransferase [Striga asiatica]|uniref:23S rRNA (2'-O-methyl-G2251)-methyltransferase n=1 Tax=Striga asiatica TaxID=4170 RepID=A0A5A7PU65_STRAF|nr:23S rRNA (2'-O-methyl-G2251)-methyltransferase [Striga asiatica]
MEQLFNTERSTRLVQFSLSFWRGRVWMSFQVYFITRSSERLKFVKYLILATAGYEGYSNIYSNDLLDNVTIVMRSIQRDSRPFLRKACLTLLAFVSTLRSNCNLV